MSMDLVVWSKRDFNLPDELPQSNLWKSYREEFAFEQERWQVLVLSEESEPDPRVVERLPDAKFVVGVSLEPIGAGDDGYAFLEEVVRSLARQTGGVWVDPNGFPYFHNEGTF